MEKIFTIKEASGLSKMSVAWWRRKIFRKEVRYLKMGRRVLIPESTLNDLFKNAIVEPMAGKTIKG